MKYIFLVKGICGFCNRHYFKILILHLKHLINHLLSNEKLTRKKIIDNRLKKAVWLVGDLSQVVEEFDIDVDENVARDAITLCGNHLFC